MAVSEERIDELLEQMLEDADDDGWCHIPKGLTEEEEVELTKRITIITMQDRIDTLMEGILTVYKYMDNVKKHMDSYDTMEKLKIKGGLNTIKEDSQGLLMDLHSTDVIHDFFRIDLISYDDEQSKEEMTTAREEMKKLIEDEFSEKLDNVKKHCNAMIEISDDITDKLNIK
jgi:hypothetical protein